MAGADILTNMGVNSFCANTENDNTNYRTEWKIWGAEDSNLSGYDAMSLGKYFPCLFSDTA
jgi:hypothetical protein